MGEVDEQAFRQRIRDYIAANKPDLPYRTGTRSPENEAESKVLRDWGRQIYEAGFYGADWPVEFGGRGEDYDAVEEFLVTEELATARAPIPIGAGSLAAHALISFGTDDQRRRYLPKIRSYDHVWCQLFSEPDAGSDLASMRTTAIRDGDHYVVNGQKVWSTNAAFSDMGYLLARTDPQAAKHAGISAFALAMDTPGITVRPLREMTGTSDFNEVFFDDVILPVDCRIGEENAGWNIATVSLASERAGVGALVIRLRQNLDALIDYARSTPHRDGRLADDPIVRQRLAGFSARVEIAALVSQASMRRRLRGEFRAMDAPLSKLGFSTLNWDLAEYGLSIQGMYATLDTNAPEAVGSGRWQDELLYAKAYNISGGSDKIMLNLLGERALGLPRRTQAVMIGAVPTTAEAAAIVERHTGGKVVDIDRQLRWRPTWFVDVERDGETLPLVLRGDRPDSKAFPLRHEYTFHRLMEEREFPVPQLLGYLELPGVIEMFVEERVPGVPHFEGVDDADRDVIVDEYVQQLARLHLLDPQPFIDAGLVHPGPGENSGMVGHRNMQERYRERKHGYCDPFAEFCVGWLERHLPDGDGRLSASIWDTGQFHHVNGHMVAILDLEFGHVGDPLCDITTWRMRDTLIPFGDMGRIYARYEQLTDRPIDLEAVKRHHFAGCMGNQLQFGAAVVDPTPETDQMNYLQWNSETNLMTTEFLGEYLGVELPEVEVPPAGAARHDPMFRQLVRALGSASTDDPELRHQLRLAFRTARHLQRRSEIGDVLDAADVDDVHQLLGRRPTDWLDAERELERFVVADAATGRYDAELTVLFHRRHLRTHMTLGPQGSSMTRHYQCQRFDGGPTRVVQL